MREKKRLSDFVTSYDLIKAFAVILMIIDHVGFYFYPDQLWYRAVGRMCVPIWFFLIGYARSRDMGWPLWAGAVILVAGNYVAGIGLFPMNIVISMLVIRMIIDDLMRHALRNRHAMLAITTILLFLIYPTAISFEYGTQGIILAMFGWLCRHKGEAADSKGVCEAFGLFALFAFAMLQTAQFGFSQPQFLVMATGLVAVMTILYYFRYAEFPVLSRGLLKPAAFSLKLMGRHTLEIYVLHLMLFKLLGAITNPERFSWFKFYWVMTPANAGMI